MAKQDKEATKAGFGKSEADTVIDVSAGDPEPVRFDIRYADGHLLHLFVPSARAVEIFEHYVGEVRSGAPGVMLGDDHDTYFIRFRGIRFEAFPIPYYQNEEDADTDQD